ncbi:hypothetical protein HYU18_05115 [Candidatus Woesearchaeota archaeon]|nr:hypothetical protein [Candidatus Woesearchaeota archaeon]
MYDVIFDKEAVDFLEKAERNVSERIYKKIMAAKDNPHQFFERLSGRPDYKLRVGD